MTDFNYTNKYIATNIRNSNDVRIVRMVSFDAKGYTFEDVTDGFTFICGYSNVGAYTGNVQAVDIRGNGSHYKVNTKSAH